MKRGRASSTLLRVGLILASLECLGASWTQTSAPSTNWSAIACSADGTKVVAAVGGKYYSGSPGPIFLSTNAGFTWFPSRAPVTNWSVLSCSADGARVAAGAFDSDPPPIFLSADAGVTWTTTTEFPTNHWIAMAGSADGRTLMAADPPYSHVPGVVFISTNTGSTWFHPQLMWDFFACPALACNADGRAMIAANNSGSFFRSTDSGATWAVTNPPNGIPIEGLAMSVDSSRIIAATMRGGIFLSSDLGDTWQFMFGTNFTWGTVACSAEATTIVAGSGVLFGSSPGPVYYSTNYGATWLGAEVPVADWAGVASSADGYRLFAASKNGGIHTLERNPSPKLSIHRAATGEAVLRWLVPSKPFVLQQTPDLGSPAWTNLVATPVLDLATLNFEVTVSSGEGASYFRLVAP